MFYSNCFLEAIKHKLKDWKHVKITYIPPRYNEVFCPHFLWSDGENDYDFGVERHIRWWEIAGCADREQCGADYGAEAG